MLGTVLNEINIALAAAQLFTKLAGAGSRAKEKPSGNLKGAAESVNRELVDTWVKKVSDE